MMSFLFRCLFFLDILFLGLLYTAKFPKRSHYPLRAALACIVGLAVSCGWAALFDGKPQLLGLYLLYESVGFLGQFFIALFCVYSCVQMQPWTCLYLGTFFWFTQQASYSIASILIGNSINFRGLITSIASLLVVALLLYWLFVRYIEAPILERIRSHTVFPSWILMLLGCLVLNSYAGFYNETSCTYYLALLLIDTVVLFYQYTIYQTLGLERGNETVRLLLTQSSKQYQIAKQNMEQVNIKCHDLRHQIRLFRGAGRIDESVLKEMEMITAGVDFLCLDPGETAAAVTAVTAAIDAGDGYIMQQLREATKANVYAASRSISVNGLSSNSIIVNIVPWWEIVLLVVTAICGIAFIGCTVACVVMTYGKKNKKVEG